MTHDAEIAFVGGREVRIFPKGWQHPRDDRGRYVPMLPAVDPVLTVGRQLTGYRFDDEDEAAVRMPNASGLAPHETEIAAYEAVSEGTPISPAFPNTPAGRLALVNFCAEHNTTFGDHRADAEAWAAVLFGDASVGIDGSVHAS